MKNVIFLLCALVLVACGKKDNQELSDYEKPFSGKSSAELKQIVQKNVDQCEALQKEINEEMIEGMASFNKAMEHYGAEIDLFGGGIMSLSAPVTRTVPEPGFTGIAYTWNPHKSTPGFDTTISANGAMEYYFPSSLTDDSKNDFHAVINFRTSELSQQYDVTIYQDEKLKIKSSNAQIDKDNIRYIEVPPYTISLKRNMPEKLSMSTRMSSPTMQYIMKKEGGASLVSDMQMVGANMEITMDYNNIRARASVNQYLTVMKLINKLLGSINEGNYNQMVLDLINKNMKPAVLVFNDSNEKIGDLSISNSDDSGPRSWLCRFRDGEQLEFKIISMPLN